MADKEDGLPIDYVDPTEGNFSLTESVAVVDKDNGDKADKAMEMAQCIIEKGRKALQKTYPLAIYEGEKDSDNKSARSLRRTYWKNIRNYLKPANKYCRR